MHKKNRQFLSLRIVQYAIGFDRRSSCFDQRAAFLIVKRFFFVLVRSKAACKTKRVFEHSYVKQHPDWRDGMECDDDFTA